MLLILLYYSTQTLTNNDTLLFYKNDRNYAAMQRMDTALLRKIFR